MSFVRFLTNRNKPKEKVERLEERRISSEKVLVPLLYLLYNQVTAKSDHLVVYRHDSIASEFYFFTCENN